MRKSFSIAALMAGSVLTADPALAQHLTGSEVNNFNLQSSKPDISEKTTGPVFSLTAPVDKKKNKEITFEIGQRPFRDAEKRSPLLSQECGTGCVAKVKWMRIQATIKFGGP